MVSLLPSGHPFYASNPSLPTYAPDQSGSCVIDSWDFATVAASGSAPDESSTRAMYRPVASVTDKYLTSETYAATGDVRHTRPDEEPYGAIDTVRGRRGLWFATTSSVASYLTLTSRGLRGLSLSAATPTWPARIAMHVRLRAGAATTGDRTLWNRNGWKAVLSVDLLTVTVIAPASTTAGSWTYPWPQPGAGFLRCAVGFLWDGTTWKFYVNGELQTATISTAFVGTLTSASGFVMTLGGASTGATEIEIDLFAAGNGAEKIANMTQWRWDNPVPMSWGQTTHRHLGDTAIPDAFYPIFQGDDGAGLTVMDVNSLVDGNGNDFFAAWGGSKNKLALIRVSGECARTITSQATSGTRYSQRTAFCGAYVNVSGGQFAATGTECRLTYNTGQTAVASHTLLKGVSFGGPASYGAQYQDEGTPLFLLGQSYKTSLTPLQVVNTIVKDAAFYFSCDNSMAAYYAVDGITLMNPVVMGMLRISDHSEAPNHDFIFLAADGATRITILGGAFIGMNQRTPGLLGTHGDALARRDAYAELCGTYVLPQGDGTRGYGGQAGGQPNNAQGATTGSAHISNRQIIFEANRVLDNDGSQLTMALTQEATGLQFTFTGGTGSLDAAMTGAKSAVHSSGAIANVVYKPVDAFTGSTISSGSFATNDAAGILQVDNINGGVFASGGTVTIKSGAAGAGTTLGVVTQTAATYRVAPVNDSSTHGVGNFLGAGLGLVRDVSKTAPRAKWSAGGRIHPLVRDAVYKASVTDTLASLPAFVRAELAACQADTNPASNALGRVRHDQFTVAISTRSEKDSTGSINPNTAPMVAVLDSLKNPNTLNWSSSANIAAEPAYFTGAVRAWADIPNGPALSALVGTKALGSILWPLIAPSIFS